MEKVVGRLGLPGRMHGIIVKLICGQRVGCLFVAGYVTLLHSVEAPCNCPVLIPVPNVHNHGFVIGRFHQIGVRETGFIHAEHILVGILARGLEFP